MLKHAYILILLLAIPTILSSCRSMTTHKPHKVTYDDYHGYYKVGNPYQIEDQWYYPKEQPDYNEVGIASWYGAKFHGKPTANGDTFDKNALTAAHNTLPLPSMVRVTNLENNKTLIVMVNDRGPFAKGRVIDLSEQSASILGFHDQGTAKVRVQFLKGQTRSLLANLPKTETKKPGITSLFKQPVQPDYYKENNTVNVADISSDDPSKPVNLMTGPLRDTVQTPTTAVINKIQKNKAPQLPTNEEYTPDFAIEAPTPNLQQQEVSTNNPKEVISPKLTSEKSPELEPKINNDPTAEEIKFVIKPEEIKSSTTEETPKISSVKPEPIQPQEQVPGHFIQAGTYGNKENALRAKHALRALGAVEVLPVNASSGQILHRVRLGPLTSMKIAKIALNKVIKLGHADAILTTNMVDITQVNK